MAIPEHLRGFWRGFAGAVGEVDEGRFYEAFCFGDSESLADELAALTLRGIKRATAAAVWSFDARPLPASGALSIVTNWAGAPLCVIRTLALDIVPFDAVPPEFAALEGEGDGSLAFWRQSHRAYFTRECERAGRRFSEDMPVACERFELVYPLPSHDSHHV